VRKPPAGFKPAGFGPICSDMSNNLLGSGGSAVTAAVDLALSSSEETNAKRVRVLVVDDQAVFRVGLSRILGEQGFDLVGQACDGEEALELAARLVPDVIVMDLSLPGMSGIETTRRLGVKVPQARVLVLTVSASDADVMDAIMAGACGYMLKGASIEDIASGIRAAAAGESLISTRIATRLLDRIRGKNADADGTICDGTGVALTKREVQILRLMADGKENKQIAQELFISPQTVKNHISNILAKLHIENRIQAAVYAVRKQIV
jgi:DNA-binding NarL/FixJ family response regulator